MKNFLHLIFFLFLTTSSLAQSGGQREEPKASPQSLNQKVSLPDIEAKTADGKTVLLKSDGTWTWKDSGLPKPAAFAGPPISTTPEKLFLFPQDFDNKLVRLSSLKIGAIQAYPQDGIYLLKVRSAGDKYFSNNLTPGLLFAVDENGARSLEAEYHKNGVTEYTTMLVNMVVMIKVVDSYTFAGIRCFEFLNYSGKVVNTLGTCGP